MKLTAVQQETMDYCRKQIDEARAQSVDLSKAKKKEYARMKEIVDAQNGLVYTQGGSCTIRTLKKLESLGLLEVVEDNSGIGMGCGAFPSKVRILNY